METMRAAEPISARADDGPQDGAPTLAMAIDRLQAMISHLEDSLGPVVMPTDQLVPVERDTMTSALGDRILLIEAQSERISRLIARLDIRV